MGQRVFRIQVARGFREVVRVIAIGELLKETGAQRSLAARRRVECLRAEVGGSASVRTQIGVGQPMRSHAASQRNAIRPLDVPERRDLHRCVWTKTKQQIRTANGTLLGIGEKSEAPSAEQ